MFTQERKFSIATLAALTFAVVATCVALVRAYSAMHFYG